MSRTLCFCNSARTWGGGEKWHLEAALAMAKRGIRCVIMAGEDTALLQRARDFPQLQTHARRFSSLDFLNPFAVAGCANFFRVQGIQRVILGLPADLKTAGLAAKQAGVQGIIYRRGSALPVKNTLLNRFLYRNILTKVIVNSRETERLIFANNAALIPKDKIFFLPNGIDIATFDAGLAQAQPLSGILRAQHPIIGSAGRLTEQKGQQYLLYMSRWLLDSGIPHTLVIAGEGEKEATLKRLASDLSLVEHVWFTGFLRSMASFWRSIDLFVLPSLWEGFGYVLAEAMLAEKTVVAFDGNSMPEIVRHGDTGLLAALPAKRETPMSVGRRLGESVRTLLENSEKARSLALGGREYCAKMYDQERCMDALEKMLWPEGGDAS